MNKIYLHLEIRNGAKVIVDQDGREVEGVIRIDSHCATDEIDSLDITVYETKPNGQVVYSGGHR